MSVGTSGYMEQAQAIASEHPQFKTAPFRAKADVLETIRNHWSEFERDGLTIEQAANAALVQILPMPWCESCRSYHHASAPHIRSERTTPKLIWDQLSEASLALANAKARLYMLDRTVAHYEADRALWEQSQSILSLYREAEGQLNALGNVVRELAKDSL